MPCCERISLASRSTRAALRSPHSPWRWQPGSSLMNTVSPLGLPSSAPPQYRLLGPGCGRDEGAVDQVRGR